MLYIGDLVENTLANGEKAILQLMETCRKDEILKESVTSYLALKSSNAVKKEYAKEFIEENVKKIKSLAKESKKYLVSVKLNENANSMRKLVSFDKSDSEYFEGYTKIFETVSKNEIGELSLDADSEEDSEILEFAMDYSSAEDKDGYVTELKQKAKDIAIHEIMKMETLEEAKKIAKASLNLGKVQKDDFENVFELYKIVNK